VISQFHPGGIMGSPMLGKPNSTFKPSNFKHPQKNSHPNSICTNFYMFGDLTTPPRWN
jgi:hypothetical protein